MKRSIYALMTMLASFCHADEKLTLTVESTAGQAGNSETVTLNQGESAELLFAPYKYNQWLRLEGTLASKAFTVGCYKTDANGNPIAETNPIHLAGPATFKLAIGPGTGAQSGFATFNITRVGIASPPASIPQEAGTTWDVILESSSDLVNWTVTNPGEYTGTEAKRFFRTRIVKKTPPAP